MDFGVAMRQLESLERELGLLYLGFAESYASEPSLAEMFGGLSNEENKHADIVNYQLRLFRRNKGQFKDIEVDTTEISRLTEHVRELKNRQESLSWEEALEVAYEMENTAAEHYMMLAGSQANPDIRGLLKAMASSCNEHHSRLGQFFINTGLDVKRDVDFEIEDHDHEKAP